MAINKYKKYGYGDKVYDVLLTQTAANAPVVDATNENTIGAIVWAYVAPGSYSATLNGAFPAGKVSVEVDNKLANIAGAGCVSVSRVDDNSLSVLTGEGDGVGGFANLDAMLVGTRFRITVRP